MAYLVVLMAFLQVIQVRATDKEVGVIATTGRFQGYHQIHPITFEDWKRYEPIKLNSYTIKRVGGFSLNLRQCYSLIYNREGQRVDVAFGTSCKKRDVKAAIIVGPDNSVYFRWNDGRCFKRSYEIIADNSVIGTVVKKSPMQEVVCPTSCFGKLGEDLKVLNPNIVTDVSPVGTEIFIASKSKDLIYESRYKNVCHESIGVFIVFCEYDGTTVDRSLDNLVYTASIGETLDLGLIIDRFQVNSCSALKNSFILTKEEERQYIIVFKNIYHKCYKNTYTLSAYVPAKRDLYEEFIKKTVSMEKETFEVNCLDYFK